MTSTWRRSAYASTVAISSASFAKFADSREGAIWIFMLVRCGRRRRRLLHDRRLLLPRDNDRDRITAAHRRAAKGVLADDNAIANPRIRFVFDGGDDQAVCLKRRPDLIEGLIDEVGHDVARRGRRDTDQHRHRRLCLHDSSLGRIGCQDAASSRRGIDVGHAADSQIHLAQTEHARAGALAIQIGDAQHERPGAQLDADRRAALDEARRAGSPVLPDHAIDRNAIRVAPLLPNVELHPEVGADGARFRDGPADQVRCRQRTPLDEVREPEIGAAAKGDEEQKCEKDIRDAATLHRCVSDLSFFSLSALYSASSYLRSRLFTRYSGMSASFQTSSTLSANTKVSPSFTSCGTSVRSLRLPSGRTTTLMFARCAAITFSLMPPTDSTLPRSVISPVMATSCLTGRSPITDAMHVAIATPADGPSFGIAPAGKWMWMSY